MARKLEDAYNSHKMLHLKREVNFKFNAYAKLNPELMEEWDKVPPQSERWTQRTRDTFGRMIANAPPVCW